MDDNSAWLDQVHEEVLEPDLRIVDPHHHLWQQREGDQDYLAAGLLADIASGHNVSATVFIECGTMYRPDGPEPLRPVGETEFISALAAASDADPTPHARVAAAIVAHADLSLGAEVAPVLEAHTAAAGGRLRGIRHGVARDPDPQIRRSRTAYRPGLLLEPRFREGVAELARHGLSFDIWLYHPQMAEITELARACPETSIIVDHFAGPIGTGPYAGRSEEVYANWLAQLGPLAELPNVVMKLGGINMEVNGFAWHQRPRPPTSAELADATRRYYLKAIDAFGPERCMFESNFPVDKLSCSYQVLWNSIKRLVADFSAGDKAQLFHGTAERAYRLAAG